MTSKIEDSNWKVFKAKVRKKWSRIKDYEIESSKYHLDLLAKKIRCKYKLKSNGPEYALATIAKESKLPK